MIKPLTQDEKELYEKILLDITHSRRSLFNGLIPSHKELALQILRERRESLSSNTLDMIWELDYVRQPLSPEKFFDDQYYVGEWYKKYLFDAWKQEICHVINTGVFEWILSGSIGAGKSTSAIGIQIYKLYRVTCMRDPCDFYRAQSIVFAFFSILKDLSEDVEVNLLLNRLRESEYFRTVVGITEEKEDKRHPRSVVLKFPNNIRFVFGSRSQHSLGQDVYSVLMDEVAFATSSDSKQVRESYTSLRRRIESRFMSGSGRMPGILTLCSSANFKGDFLDKHMEKVRGKRGVHITNFSVYHVKKSEFENQPRFRVLVGDERHTSKILDTVWQDEDGNFKITQTTADIPIESRIEEVPAVFYERYIEDTEGALKDISGIALFSAHPFMPNREKLLESIDKNRTHPFTELEPILSITDDDYTLESIFNKDEMFIQTDPFRRTYQPKINPGSPRFIHFDLAKTHDSVGAACCHLAGVKKVIRTDVDGRPREYLMPVIYIDFVLRVRPPLGSEIDFTKLTSFVFYLRDLGMPVGSITFDQYQSSYHIQIMKKSGIESKEISMDRTPAAYMALKSGFMAGCIMSYNYPRLFEELNRLQRNPGKRPEIDHPADGNGSKDVSDALAGAHFACISSQYAEERLIETKFKVETEPLGKAVTPDMGNTWTYSDKSNEDIYDTYD